MCRWNSDFPGRPTTTTKLKANLRWKVAEALMQGAAGGEQTGGDCGPSFANGFAAVRGAPVALVRLQPCGTAAPRGRELLRPEGSIQARSTESSPKAEEPPGLYLGLATSSGWPGPTPILAAPCGPGSGRGDQSLPF